MPDPTFAVFDIDGVLADVTHRLHHLCRPRKDWSAFFAAAPDDPLLAEGRRRVHQAAHEHAIVYVTGRPAHLRPTTQDWLDRHALPSGALLMRPSTDRRPAPRVKVELLAQVAKAGRIALVVDDDEQVCDTLRACGYPVELAAWATASQALREAADLEGRT